MNFKQFKNQIQKSIPQGTKLDNPGGGSSIVSSYTNDKISYMRGKSPFYVLFRDLFDAYLHFKGRRVTTSDLKAYEPSIFDSAARPAARCLSR